MIASVFLSLVNNERHHHKCRLFPHWHIPHNKGANSCHGRLTNILPLGCNSHTVLLLLLTAAIAAAPLMLTWHSSRGPGDVCECTRVFAQTIALNGSHFLTSSTACKMDENWERTRNAWDKWREEGKSFFAGFACCCFKLIEASVALQYWQIKDPCLGQS